MARKALGRGLRALIPEPPYKGQEAEDKPSQQTTGSAGPKSTDSPADLKIKSHSALLSPQGSPRDVLRNIPLEEIVPNSRQPRTQWDPEELKDLAKSIRSNGLLEPILVRPRDGKYEIVAGERRWRSCKLAGWKQIPAIIRNLEDQQSLESALIENIQRSDLNPVDEARAYQMLSSDFGLTHEEIATRVGKDRSTVSNLLRLLGLSHALLDHVSRETLSLGHARVLLTLPEDRRLSIAKRMIDESWSVRDAESWAKKASGEQSKSRRRASRGVRKTDAILHIEEQLRRHLSAEVHVRPGRHGGKLEVRYHDDEELSRLLDQLGVIIS